MSDIDAALAVLDTKYILIDGHDAKEIDAAITLALNALTTLRDLKQELKENGDMSRDIWAWEYKEEDVNYYENGFISTAILTPERPCQNTKQAQYTRTTPTLKKILEGL